MRGGRPLTDRLLGGAFFPFAMIAGACGMLSACPDTGSDLSNAMLDMSLAAAVCAVVVAALNSLVWAAEKVAGRRRKGE